jgi:hypothetical protein
MTLRWVLIGGAMVAEVAQAQAPEMARLAKVLAGDWRAVEVVQDAKPVPEGQGRRGTTHVRLAAGGTVLVDEGHTVGSVGGELNWFTAIWWDAASRRYRWFTCFKASDANGCQLRGTGHWAGDTFVNDYDEAGTKARDVWSDITPNSFTLTEFHGDTAYVVSRLTRDRVTGAGPSTPGAVSVAQAWPRGRSRT